MTNIAVPSGQICPDCGQHMNSYEPHKCPSVQPVTWHYTPDSNELQIEILDTLKDIKAILESIAETLAMEDKDV
jgi:hypothetical protein